MKSVKRCEDMRPLGKGVLEVLQEDDGDIIVALVTFDGDWNDASRFSSTSVQFCAAGGAGGGRSPRTREALLALMRAIEDDNQTTPLFDRNSEVCVDAVNRKIDPPLGTTTAYRFDGRGALDSIERVAARLHEYSLQRQADIARGAQTPRLAAMLMQTYGLAMIDAAQDVFGQVHVRTELQRHLNEQTDSLDPSWRDSIQARLNLRPADIQQAGAAS